MCVDRRKFNANNILVVVWNDTEDSFYKVGTKIISSLYVGNQIFECKEQFISSKDVPQVERQYSKFT